MKIKRESDGTLTITGVTVNADPQPSKSTGKALIVIKGAVKAKGLLPNDLSRECTINVTCYPPVDPNASSNAVDLSA